MATNGRPEPANTEERLLDTAERLFAERGIDAVSVRTITSAAGANVAAAHYYFRSKEGLVQAIFTRRMGEIGARRAELLSELEQRDAVLPAEIVAVMVRPLAELVVDPDDQRGHYVGFLASAMSSRGPVRAQALESFRPQLRRFTRLLATALPAVPREVRLSRFMIVVDSAIQELADLDWASLPWSGNANPIGRPELVEHLIDALAGTLIGAGPVRNPGSPTTTGGST